MLMFWVGYMVFGSLLHSVKLFHKVRPRETNGLRPRTDSSVGWASGCRAGGRELNSGRTNSQVLKITE